MTARDEITRLTHWVEDFPVAGVRFADLTPVFADGGAFREIVGELSQCAGDDVDMIAAIDARGFLVGGGVADRLGTGLLAVRKKGKLPPPVHAQEFALEYGSDRLEIPATSVSLKGTRVLVVDDVLATGGTLVAASALLEAAGATVVGVGVVLEIGALRGRERMRERLGGTPVSALLTV
ncbi:adenine phosphoribosyltransferase [Rhodococcus rhodnii]|nr:adenine phosphoribosyltransferase [Rhodococcus rhodnii]TXG91052.1 adenine phosphoribosyltransferase [Rhodococcus rhodnii]